MNGGINPTWIFSSEFYASPYCLCADNDFPQFAKTHSANQVSTEKWKKPFLSVFNKSLISRKIDIQIDLNYHSSSGLPFHVKLP